MSNIRMGDYIHWRYSSYINNGLSVSKGNATSRADAIKIFQEQRRRVLELCPKQNMSQSLEDLEKKLNFFYGSRNSAVISEDFTPEQNAAIQEYMRQITEKTISEMYPKLTENTIADYSNLSASKIAGDTTSRRSKGLAARNKAVNFNRANQSRTTYGAISKSLNELIAFRDTLEPLIKCNADLTLINKVDELKKKYQNFIDKVNKTVSSQYYYAKDTKHTGLQYSGMFKQVSFREEILDNQGNVSTVGDFAREIQNLVDMTKQATAVALEGVLGEIVPVAIMTVWEQFQTMAAGDVMTALEDLQLQDYIVDLVKGQAKVAQQRTKKMTTANKVLAKRGISGDMQAQIGNAKIRASYTQDKVDIALNVGSGEIVNVSAKNINLNSGYNISLLSGANLVNYVQDYPEFVNHYLNVTADIVENDPGSNGYFSDRGAYLGQPIIAARDSMKMTIALHALTGGVIGQSKEGVIGPSAQAALFIVNDNSTGRFHVYSTQDLLSKIDENLRYLKVEGVPDLWTNRWVGRSEKNIANAFARSASILAQMHEVKLKVSLDPAILKS